MENDIVYISTDCGTSYTTKSKQQIHKEWKEGSINDDRLVWHDEKWIQIKDLFAGFKETAKLAKQRIKRLTQKITAVNLEQAQQPHSSKYEVKQVSAAAVPQAGYRSSYQSPLIKKKGNYLSKLTFILFIPFSFIVAYGCYSTIVFFPQTLDQIPLSQEVGVTLKLQNYIKANVLEVNLSGRYASPSALIQDLNSIAQGAQQAPLFGIQYDYVRIVAGDKVFLIQDEGWNAVSNLNGEVKQAKEQIGAVIYDNNGHLLSNEHTLEDKDVAHLKAFNDFYAHVSISM
ncbi:MAG: hypothetical protein AAGA18_05770 [Verrucomicrobiota bacterium]